VTEHRADVAQLRPAPHPSVATALLPPEAVLYDERHGEVHLLNGPAAVIWQLLDGQQTAEQLAIELSDVFSVPLETMQRDVADAIGGFQRLGLLEGSPARSYSTDPTSAVADTAADVPDTDDDAGPLRLTVMVRPPHP
jgi:PqqD family protein of HPr-rel-A system